MPRDGAGTYSLPAGNPVVTGTTISSTTHNNTNSDLATALTNSLAKDGQTTPTAHLTMGTYRLTNLGAGTAVADAPRVSQVQNSGFTFLSSVSGTNTITASATPTPAAYAAGQTFSFIPANTITGATTLNVSSLGAKNIFWNGGACAGGEIRQNVPCDVTYDGTQFNLLAQGGAINNTPIGVTNPAQGNFTNLGATGNITVSGVVAATGNVTGGNISTAGVVVATGNVTGGNVTTAGVITATGNVSGGNITTGGDVSGATVTPPSGTKATTWTFDGSGGTSGSVTLAMHKVGNFVTLRIPAVTATSGTGSTVFTTNTAIDAAFRPSSTQAAACTMVFNNGAGVSGAGVIIINTSGILQFYRDNTGAAFTNASTCGIANSPITITYYTA